MNRALMEWNAAGKRVMNVRRLHLERAKVLHEVNSRYFISSKGCRIRAVQTDNIECLFGIRKIRRIKVA